MEIQSFVLANTKNGYCLKWRLYSGKEPELHRQEDISKTYEIVTNLAFEFKKRYLVHMDSYNTSPHLAIKLSERNCGMYGIVNCNKRGMPSSLKPT